MPSQIAVLKGRGSKRRLSTSVPAPNARSTLIDPLVAVELFGIEEMRSRAGGQKLRLYLFDLDASDGESYLVHWWMELRRRRSRRGERKEIGPLNTRTVCFGPTDLSLPKIAVSLDF